MVAAANGIATVAEDVRPRSGTRIAAIRTAKTRHSTKRIPERVLVARRRSRHFGHCVPRRANPRLYARMPGFATAEAAFPWQS